MGINKYCLTILRSMSEMDKEVAAARDRMKARFGGAGKSQMGCKGTQRRVHAKRNTNSGPSVAEDKKLMAVVNKFSPKTIADIEEANFFHKDNTVLNIRRPLIHYAFKD